MIKAAVWILIIGVIGFGGYIVVQKDKVKTKPLSIFNENEVATSQDGESVQPGNSNTDQTGKKVPFSSFLATAQSSGESYQCSADQYLSDVDTENLVFISGKNIRVESKHAAEGQLVTSWAIVKDGFMYMWQNSSNEGIKVSTDLGVIKDTQVGMSGTYIWSPQQFGEYDCKQWDADMTVFTLPARVKFTELTLAGER